MKCPHCGGLLRNDTFNNDTPRDGQFIVIYGDPRCKCNDCGTVLYRGHVMQKLEKMVDDTPKTAGKVVMLDYPDSDMEVYNGH